MLGLDRGTVSDIAEQVRQRYSNVLIETSERYGGNYSIVEVSGKDVLA